jgi:UTP-glucose-1-phosphate uridylyltransferase
MRPTLLILAAGMGSRYGGLKQIDPIGPSGEAIIDYSIYDAIRAGFGKITFVIRRDLEEAFRELFEPKLSGRIEMEYVFQELDMVPDGTHFSSERVKPWGTAHAVWVAKDHISEPFAVINADDFYGAGSYMSLANFLGAENDLNKSAYSMIGYQVKHTLSDFGSVSRGICDATEDDYLKAVVERTEIIKDGKEYFFSDESGTKVNLQGDELVSMNIWGFTPAIFDQLEHSFSEFIKINADQIKSELYIPKVVNDLVSEGVASVKILPATDQWFGVTYQEDKPAAVENIRKLVADGIYPEKLWD